MDNFAVQTLGFNLNSSETYLTEEELKNAKASIEAGGQGTNGIIQLNQRYHNNNLGGYLTDAEEEEFPKFSLANSDNSIFVSSWLSKALKTANKYSNEYLFYIDENTHELKVAKDLNELRKYKYPILHFSSLEVPCFTTNCIITISEEKVFVNFLKNSENSYSQVYNLYYSDSDSNILDITRSFDLNRIKIRKYIDNKFNDKDFNSEGISIETIEIPNLQPLIIKKSTEESIYLQRIEQNKTVLLGAFHTNTMDSIGNLKTIYCFGQIKNFGEVTAKFIKGDFVGVVDNILQTNLEKNSTNIINIVSKWKIDGLSLVLNKDKNYLFSEKNGDDVAGNINDIIEYDDKNNKKKIKNFIGYMYLRFRNPDNESEEKIVCYKVNNKTINNHKEKYDNVYQTLLPYGQFDHTYGPITKDRITYYQTSYLDFPTNKQKTLNPTDVIFVGYTTNLTNNSYSKYWADNTATAYGVDLYKNKNESDGSEQVIKPEDFIRYNVITTDNNGRIIKQESGTYSHIEWLWEQFYGQPLNLELDSLTKSSKITNSSPNVTLDAYETIFSFTCERLIASLPGKIERIDENYGISNWQDESVKTIEKTDGTFDRDKFINKTQAVNWIVNKVINAEGIVYYDPATKLATNNNTGYAMFYCDPWGILTIGHGITNNCDPGGDLREYRDQKFKEFVKILRENQYTVEQRKNQYIVYYNGVKCENGRFNESKIENGKTINSGEAVRKAKNTEGNIKGEIACAITTTKDEELYKNVIYSKVASAHVDCIQGSNLKYTLGQLVTLGALYYNGTGNITDGAKTDKVQLKSSDEGWKKIVQAEIDGKNGRTFKIGDDIARMYLRDYADEIAKFHFFTGEDSATKDTSKKASSSDYWRYEVNCYAIEVPDRANQITISTFWKDELFKTLENGKWQLCAEGYSDLLKHQKGICCLFTYLVPQYQRDEAVKDGSTGSDTGIERLRYNEVREFIEGFRATLETKTDKNPQDFLDVDGYYDLYSGMTPYIIAGFRDKNISKTKDGKEEYKFNYIDSITHPYFVSLKVEDNGVKTIELQLFDKDFGSYQKGIVFNSPALDVTKDVVAGKVEGATPESLNEGYSTRVYSLENLIRGALSTPNISNSGETNNQTGREGRYKSNAGSTKQQLIQGNFLKFSEAKNYSPTNLRVRFGYADKNMYTFNQNMDYYRKKGVYTSKDEADKPRDYRWWDVTTLLEDDNRTLKVYKSIQDLNDKYFQDKEETIQNKEELQINTVGSSVAAKEKESSGDQTTKMSYFIDCMITGYKTSLQNNGILYTITAIETKEARLMKTRFLQRFATINSYPEEVLYILMKLFNEDSNGENVTKCPVKLYMLENTEAPENYRYELVQQLDLSKINDEERAQLSAAITSSGEINTIQLAQSPNHVEIKPEWLKTINLNFGGQSALKNYAQFYENEQNNPPIYKNVYSLLNEFCAACPPFIIPREQYTTTNINGEQVTIESVPEAQRRLSWFSCNVDGKYIAVFFYYRKPEKVKKIRRYTWGPENTSQTVITNLSIENANEFAVLSGVESFNGETGKIELRTAEGNIFKRDESGNRNARTATFDGATDSITSGKNYEVALASCMYKGSIQIMGDPFYLFFGANMQPCTYPIYLRVLVPKSEFERRAYDTNGEDYNAITEQKDIFGERGTFGNQQLHEMSGYYVINKITHNISASGFTTTLEVMSYPGIVNDVIDKKNCTERITGTLKS